VNWAFQTRRSINGAKNCTPHGPEAFPGSGHQTTQEEEVRRLKRELEIVKQERDILKKALGIFSRAPQ
jgi:transposase